MSPDDYIRLYGQGRKVQVRNQAYEGASHSKRTAKWSAPSGGPNHLLTHSLATLRNRTRAGYRNNPWMHLGVDRLVSNEIGTGIIPRSRIQDEALREAVRNLWDRSAPQLDADWTLDVYGLQALACRTRQMTGEVFIRRRPRPLGWQGLAVPMQIQVLEPDFVPETENRTLRNGNEIKAGIEVNRRGLRVAYWMYTHHPGEMGHQTRLIRVPARDVLHCYLPPRPGQMRGEPVNVAGLVRTFTFDSYDDAELVRKQTRAPFTGFLYREERGEDDWQFDPFTGQPLNEDGLPTVDVNPGTFLTGIPGEKLELFGGDDAGRGYRDYMRQQLLAICAAHGAPYEVVTGDWSGVNDRLVRAILQEFRRAVEASQDHLTIHQFLRGLWGWWMDAGVLASALSLPDYANRRHEYLAHEWRPQAWPYMHPEQDVNAKLKAIAGNLTSGDAEVAKSGFDAEEIDRQNIEGEKRRRRLRREAGLPEQTNNPA